MCLLSGREKAILTKVHISFIYLYERGLPLIGRCHATFNFFSKDFRTIRTLQDYLTPPFWSFFFIRHLPVESNLAKKVEILHMVGNKRILCETAIGFIWVPTIEMRRDAFSCCWLFIYTIVSKVNEKKGLKITTVLVWLSLLLLSTDLKPCEKVNICF